MMAPRPASQRGFGGTALAQGRGDGGVHVGGLSVAAARSRSAITVTARPSGVTPPIVFNPNMSPSCPQYRRGLLCRPRPSARPDFEAGMAAAKWVTGLGRRRWRGGEMLGLLAAGALGPGRPTTYELAEGPKALADLEARATVGKLALLP
ncbi:hypothetical protein GCM10023195_28250 [Actinoallomurus liliacearum]|uniref:Alcohol dehydrogenase-like C-terminal domain-containing protein n=2 Tax=Actinoallomurus liliacearum TaxID=1080073 RepID=A0ABP8TG50_9ACTN